MGKPFDVDDKTFDERVLKGKLPVMVDFWAPWCGPCHMVSPLVEELADEYDGKVDFVKLNVDKSAVTANRYGISSIPTLLIFKEGKPAEQIVGFRPKRDLKKSLDKVLK